MIAFFQTGFQPKWVFLAPPANRLSQSEQKIAGEERPVENTLGQRAKTQKIRIQAPFFLC